MKSNVRSSFIHFFQRFFRRSLSVYIVFSAAAHLSIALLLDVFDSTKMAVPTSIDLVGLISQPMIRKKGSDAVSKTEHLKKPTSRVAPQHELKSADGAVVSAVVPKPESFQMQPGDSADTQQLSGSAVANSLNTYITSVVRLVAAQREYPPSALARQEEGRVVVEVSIDSSGRLLESHLKTPSPKGAFNTAALIALKKISRFPPLPKELGKTEIKIDIPIEYSISESNI